jgi:hypothetical protein
MDAFWTLMLISLAAVPLALALRRVKLRRSPAAVRAYQRALVFDNRRVTIRAGQDRIRSPSLTVLLGLELCL